MSSSRQSDRGGDKEKKSKEKGKHGSSKTKHSSQSTRRAGQDTERSSNSPPEGPRAPQDIRRRSPLNQPTEDQDWDEGWAGPEPTSQPRYQSRNQPVNEQPVNEYHQLGPAYHQPGQQPGYPQHQPEYRQEYRQILPRPQHSSAYQDTNAEPSGYEDQQPKAPDPGFQTAWNTAWESSEPIFPPPVIPAQGTHAAPIQAQHVLANAYVDNDGGKKARGKKFSKKEMEDARDYAKRMKSAGVTQPDPGHTCCECCTYNPGFGCPSSFLVNILLTVLTYQGGSKAKKSGATTGSRGGWASLARYQSRSEADVFAVPVAHCIGGFTERQPPRSIEKAVGR